MQPIWHPTPMVDELEDLTEFDEPDHDPNEDPSAYLPWEHIDDPMDWPFDPVQV